jgi:hypothetical protein
MHQVLHIQRPNIKQLDPTIYLLTQVRPIQIEKRVIPRYLANHVVRYSRPFPQPRQMQLLHLALPAHVVHQKVGVAFASNKSHNTSFSEQRTFLALSTHPQG